MMYTVYLKDRARFADNIGPDGEGLESLEAIPDGPAKWALIFPPFWLIRHRLWFELVVYVMISFFLLALLATSLRLASGYLAVLPGIYLLLEGNQLRRYKAERNGSVIVGVVDAKNESEAIERFIHRWEPEAKPVQTEAKKFPTQRQKPEPAMGLFMQPKLPGRS